MMTVNHRAWRKLVKKQQRKRRRQKSAKERDKKDSEEQRIREADPEYQTWLQQQTELEQFQRQAAERLHQDEEEAWLRREALAQRQFQLDAAKRKQEEAEIERLRTQQAEELAALQQEQRQRQEEKKRLQEQAAAEFEAMMQRMQEYMDNSVSNTPPAELHRMVDTHPGERLCEFFTRTNCCRFGHSCTFNHRRPMLSKILLIRHFFTHPLLQGNGHTPETEYASADEQLEMSEHDLRADYDEFFKDVTVELEKFGKIVNFRTVRNTLPHLRGHVFVEYTQERFALRAFVNLQGRYYASRRLNVEFSNLNKWRGAICGLSLTRKCPKGYNCGYLHIFRNPRNLFNATLESHSTPASARIGNKTPVAKTPSWNDNEQQSRNWRWSESPEPQSNGNEVHRSRSRSRESNGVHRSRQDSHAPTSRESKKVHGSGHDSERRRESHVSSRKTPRRSRTRSSSRKRSSSTNRRSSRSRKQSCSPSRSRKKLKSRRRRSRSTS